MKRTATTAAILAALAAVPAMQAPSAEWPQHLGPTRNGVAATAIPASAKLAVAWKKPLPSGSAGIVVADGRAYTLGSDGEEDLVLAFDATTGEEVWRHSLGATHPDVLMGPASTPVISGPHIVAIGTNCEMQAIDRRTRAVAWRVNFAERFKSVLPKRGGCNMSPLVAGDRLVFGTGAPDARLAAVDPATGETRWTAAVLPSYGGSQGILSQDGGVILHHHLKQETDTSGITALDPATGKTLWQIEGTDGASGAVPVPLDRTRLLVERWPHTSLYDLTTRAAIWTSRDVVAVDNPSIHHRGHIFGFGGQGGEFLTCLDAATGKVAWSQRIYRGHLVLTGDTMVVLSNGAGTLRLLAADPSGYRELAKVDVLRPGARTPTIPTVAGGRILIRNYEEIVGISVAGS